MKKIELLAPAGNMECFNAAIHSGCDAVYIGGNRFNARMNAENFTDEEIVALIKKAHIFQVKVYVGLNITIFEDEMEELFQFVDFLYLHDVDALIVSDLGLIQKLKRRYSDLEIHVSTQQNVHNAAQLQFFEAMGVERVVLAREVDLDEIKKMQQKTNLELEVFAHGALCVCYSGNCYHSSLIGQRSGNRGKCAQPCRMEYTLLENNHPISEKKYLLSMKDLNTIQSIGDLIESGVRSLKIEGRMKSKEYVYYVVSSYRKAIDEYYSSHQKKIDTITLNNLNRLFSREFTKGYIGHAFPSEVTNSFRPNHIGELVGKVISSNQNKVKIQLCKDIEQKDKIVFLQKEDVSFYLTKISVKGKLVNKAYKNEIVEIEVNSKIENHALVYRNVNHQLMQQIHDEEVEKKFPIRMKFVAHIGQEMILQVRDFDNNYVVVTGNIVEKALNSPTKLEKIQTQLLKLNTTYYRCENVKIDADEEIIISLSQINELRRQAIELLNQKRSQWYHRTLSPMQDLPELPYIAKKQVSLNVSVKNIYQLEAVAKFPIGIVYYEDIDTYFIAKKQYPNLHLVLSLPRIDMNHRPIIPVSEVMVQQFGDIINYKNKILHGGLYLNIANTATLETLVQFPFDTLTISLELNKNRLMQMIDAFKQKHGFLPNLEMVMYGRYQTMVMKHCFISKELKMNRMHCGMCKNKKLSLLDRRGYIFPILTDKDCNVTIYNSKITHLIDSIDEVLAMGISQIRLDFSVENPQEVERVCQAYLAKMNHEDVDLKLFDVTYGHYYSEEI